MNKTEAKKHTPTPWEIKKSPIAGANYEIWTPLGKKAGFAYLQEDAAFIVQAVNAHERAMSALRNIRTNAEALPEIIARGGCRVGDMEAVAFILSEAESALKLAGVK